MLIKEYMRRLIQLKLKVVSKMILAKYKPEVIGITGSVGKTSAKEAIYTVLKKKYNTRRNIKNYNNEIGVPLTIIGVDSPGKSIFGWAGVFFKAINLILFKDKYYPEVLILEMGIDRPGDMKYLTSIARCKIGVVTLIGPVHLEFFGSINNIQKEKGRLIEAVPKDGLSILNYDDEKTREINKMSKAKVLTYGLNEKADIRAQEINFSFDHNFDSVDFNNLDGISFKLTHRGSFVPVLLPIVIGKTAVYAALAGATAGIALGMNLVEIAEALKNFEFPRGRMNLIRGVKNTLIVDDTYNSSPQATLAVLEVFRRIPVTSSARRFAVLGDMLELGSYSEEGHREVGNRIAASKIDKLITVGERSRDVDRGAEEAGMSRNNIFNFDTAEEAGKFVQDRIKEGDLILVKGSQGMRMEKIVLEIMAEPMRAKELLVRQDEQWKD